MIEVAFFEGIIQGLGDLKTIKKKFVANIVLKKTHFCNASTLILSLTFTLCGTDMLKICPNLRFEGKGGAGKEDLLFPRGVTPIKRMNRSSQPRAP